MARIENVVVRSVVSLPESATFAEAAALMSERRIGSLGVRRDGRLVGIVTERDLLARLAEGADPTRAPVAQAMQAPEASVPPWASDRECADLMKAHRTRHLAVVEGGEVIGIVSMLDLVELVVDEKQWSIDQLESYIRGGRAAQLSQPLSSPFTHAATAAA